MKLNVLLFKEEVEDFDSCLKESYKGIQCIGLKNELGLDGMICFSQTISKKPIWKLQVDRLAVKEVDIGDNTSNKVAILVRVKRRILAILFGYGRSLIREEFVERNFGLKVALNLINPEKMKSINAATIEDVVVNTQRQASRSTGQEEFGIDIESDIMRGVTGEALDIEQFKMVTGKDALVVTSFMDLMELKDKLELIMSSYSLETYKTNGFEWVDNVKEVRDPSIKELLSSRLIEDIKNKKLDDLYVTVPEVIDWEETIGFCLGGMKKNRNERSSYTIDIDFSEYVDKLDLKCDISAKLKRDRLYIMNSNETVFSKFSLYSCLTYQVKHDNNMYILNSDSWYIVETNFYDEIYNYVKNQVDNCDLSLPECLHEEREEDYSKRVCESNPNLCLMDQTFLSVLKGHKKIEACDIWTKDKKFIHIKPKTKSAQLSHLFAQGKISALCFIEDESYRSQLYKLVKDYTDFDPTKKPKTDDYEIVYAIIDKSEKDICDSLPFFSLLNLMNNVRALKRMNYRCSIMKIQRKDEILIAQSATKNTGILLTAKEVISKNHEALEELAK